MKIINFILVVIFASCVANWFSSANSDDDHYIGAVVDYASLDFEYDVLNKTTAQLYMLENLKYFDEFTKEAKKNGAQIILFSEYGIIGSWKVIKDRETFFYFLEVIPDPKIEKVIACNNTNYDDRPIFQKLSCIAIESQIYLTVDYADLQYCNKSTDSRCPDDGKYQYNAELAFSPNGTLIAKYYKTHLFDEAKFANYPPFADPVYFDSDFGVRFGMFICFDIMWKYPQTDLIEKFNVKNFLYSTEWINLNIIPAIANQQAWSKTSGFNFLASNSGIDITESGSGIYSAGEVLAYTVNKKLVPKSTLLVSRIPKDPSPEKSKNLSQFSKVIHFEKINQSFKQNKISENPIIEDNDNYIQKHRRLRIGNVNFTAIPFQLVPNIEQTVQATNIDLTCTFTFKSPSTKNQLLVLIAYDGIIQNDPREEPVDLQICSIFVCSGPTVENCNELVFDSEIQLSNFSLHGNFSKGRRVFPQLLVHPFENVGIYDEKTYTLSAENIEKYNFVGTSFFNPLWDGQTREIDPNSWKDLNITIPEDD